jgi:Pyruvate/2-oxoacid:ferredoxin oxidoreductase delta subunit
MDVYRKLQKHIDKMPVGFPATESGVEIRILKRLFTPEEAQIALALSAIPESVERIHHRLKEKGIDLEELAEKLQRMAEKGAITGANKRYSKAMLAIGMYEYQVDRITGEMQRDFRRYMEEGFAEAVHSRKTSQMRTIPINEEVIFERRVSPFDSVKELIKDSEGPFAARNCVCRQGMDALEQSCKQTDMRRVCLMLKSTAKASIAEGVAEPLTREETFKLLDKAEDVGMILQPENTQDPNYICLCCGCCCGVLVSAKLFPKPAEYFHNNYYAVVDPELCTACETCADRCQMEAIGLTNGHSEVDLDRCIGCGLCVAPCPSDAITLKRKKKETVPPGTRKLLYQQIIKERFGVLGTLKIAGKAILGMKI